MKLKIKTSLLALVLIIVPLMIPAATVSLVLSPTTTYAASCEDGDAKKCIEGSKANAIMVKILFFIRFLSALVLVVAVIMIIIGGIQYTTSNGNPQAVAAAKKRISDVFIGLLAYIFLWAFLEWLIPGGLWK